MGQIKFRLLRNQWITPSDKTTGLLYAIVKRDGVSPIIKAIEHLEKEGYKPPVVNDLSSRVTILYLSKLSKELPTDEKGTQAAKDLLANLIKDALDDDRR